MSQNATNQATGMSLGLFIFLLLWPLIVVGAAVWRFQPILQTEQPNIRPVVVIDTNSYLQGVTTTDTKAMKRQLQRRDADAQRLAQAGYIVLMDNQVLAAPPEARVAQQ